MNSAVELGVFGWIFFHLVDLPNKVLVSKNKVSTRVDKQIGAVQLTGKRVKL